MANSYTFLRSWILVSCLLLGGGSAIAHGLQQSANVAAGLDQSAVSATDESGWAPVQWRGGDEREVEERIVVRQPLPVLDLEIPQGYSIRVVLTEASRDYEVTARLMSRGHPMDEDPGVEMRRKPDSREVSFRFRRRTRDGEQIVIVARPPMRRGPRQRIVVRVR